MNQIWLLLAILLLISTESRAEQWRGIFPMKSTRADVERLLGKPIANELRFFARYQFENERATIRFATDYDLAQCEGACCALQLDIVTQIDVEPVAKKTFSTLAIDKSKLEWFPLVEDTNVRIYDDREAGLEYWVSMKDDVLLSTRYLASAKVCAGLREKP
jgi:hypothetical protein